MCIPHWSHCGSVITPPCIITILDFQCLYMKFSLNLPGLCALSGHHSTRHNTDVMMRGKDTTYVSIPPPQTFTPGSVF